MKCCRVMAGDIGPKGIGNGSTAFAGLIWKKFSFNTFIGRQRLRFVMLVAFDMDSCTIIWI
jgi:hypothetical protein